MYGKRLLLRPPTGDPIFAGFRPGVFSLYFGDAPIYHFDGEGRWQRAFVAGTHYLKGLDATVQAIDRIREGANLVLKRRTLGYAEASDLDAQVRAAALDVLDALGAGRLARRVPPGPTPALSGRRAARRPGAGRRLGRGRLVRTPRALPRHVRPAAPASPRLPERPGPPGDPRARRRNRLRPGRGGRARGPLVRGIRHARPGRSPSARPAARAVPDRLPGRQRRPPAGARDRGRLRRGDRRDVSHRPRIRAATGAEYARFRDVARRNSTPSSTTSLPPCPAGPTGGGCATDTSAASASGSSRVPPRSGRCIARTGLTTTCARSWRS